MKNRVRFGGKRAGGIRIFDFGPGNVIAHNEIYNVNCGVAIMEWGGPNLRVYGNHFHDIDKGLMVWPTPDYGVDPARTDVHYGMSDLQVYNNLFTTFFMALRPAGEADRQGREVFFYRNRMWSEPGVEGRAWFTWDKGPAGPHRYYLYHNSYSGGGDVVTERPENMRFVNNIFSMPSGVLAEAGHVPALLDCNWCGGVSQPGEHWPESGRVPWPTLNQPPHDHNHIHEGKRYWPDASLSSFSLSKEGARGEAVGTALDLTKEKIDGILLPAFAADAFLGHAPDMGAVPFGREAPVAGTLGVPLDRTGWTACASEQVEAAARVLDGDGDTRWSSRGGPAWLVVDMQQAQRFSRVVLEALPARADYPRDYEVFVSQDGHDWGVPTARGAGTDTVTIISFAEQKARYLEVTRTDAGKQPWSLHEFRVCRTLRG